ncbi:hypothetical protein CBS101457_000616 [Exobasidium rhododendri]|nr:hypothetical protein CBS101457_000616 [Exobasidium rhododendri]
MFESITSNVPFFSSAAKKEERKDDVDLVLTDPQGRTRGLEDPADPALIDDPAIFQSTLPVIKAKALKAGQISSKSLIASDGKAYIDPKLYGGTNLDSSAGLGEPLNVIISGLSSPTLLTSKGLQNYLRSLDLDFECFGLHSGGAQTAWLDTRGSFAQQFLYRQVYTPLDHIFGTCAESLGGGNHVRCWQQAGTGAWFLAASKEQNVTQQHDIVPNGYDVGRDWMVGQIQSSTTNKTSFMFKSYQTKVEYVSGLIAPGTAGINHGISTDGRVALLTVKLLSSSDKTVLATKKKQVKADVSSAHKKRFSLPAITKLRLSAT